MDLSKRILTVFILSVCIWQLSAGGTIIDYRQVKELQQYVENVKNEVIKVVNASNAKPRDCLDILQDGNSKSGIYRIWPLNWIRSGSFQVYCDMETEGGGWTVLQRRTPKEKTSYNFKKSWEEYQKGFGSLDDYFWLGNDRIFSLTDQGKYSLRIDLKQGENSNSATYKEFWIENESYLYKLHISGYDGKAGDSLSKANGAPFSTFDSVHNVPERKCNFPYSGGWWYNDCYTYNLNGLYLRDTDKEDPGILWITWLGHQTSLSEASMKIRRI